LGLLALRKISNNIHQFGNILFTAVELTHYNNSIDATNTEANIDISHVDQANIYTWPSLYHQEIF